MELRKIQSLKDLKAEKKRLRGEADMARKLLQDQVDAAIERGQTFLTRTLPVTLVVGAAGYFGLKAIRRGSGGEAKLTAFLDEAQETISNFLREPLRHLSTLLPLAIRAWQIWSMQQAGAEEAPSNGHAEPVPETS